MHQGVHRHLPQRLQRIVGLRSLPESLLHQTRTKVAAQQRFESGRHAHKVLAQFLVVGDGRVEIHALVPDELYVRPGDQAAGVEPDSEQSESGRPTVRGGEVQGGELLVHRAPVLLDDLRSDHGRQVVAAEEFEVQVVEGRARHGPAVEGTVSGPPTLGEDSLVLTRGLTGGRTGPHPHDSVEAHGQGGGCLHVDVHHGLAPVGRRPDGEGRPVQDPAVVPEVGEGQQSPVADVHVVDRGPVVRDADEDVPSARADEIVGHRADGIADGVTALAFPLGGPLELEGRGLTGPEGVGQIYVMCVHTEYCAVRPTPNALRRPRTCRTPLLGLRATV